MCEEYTEGSEALERWQRAAHRKAEITELRESLAELEEEILQTIRDGGTLGTKRRFRGRRP
jgi:hypothetical protein